jgi:DNA-binding NarL/FixJ family response regulator
MSDKMKIIIVDDNSTFLEGISSCITDDEQFEVIGQFHSGIQLLESNELFQADILLMDIEMPGLSGIETAKRVNYLDPKLKMIAITLYQEKVYLQQIIEAGFKGFVNKMKIAEDLFKAIDSVNNGKFYVLGRY